MSGRKAAGTSKALAIDVDDWEGAKPGSSSKPAKNASQPQRTEIDLVSDEDEIVMQGRRWVNKSANDVVYKGKNSKGKVPPPNLKPINEKKQKKTKKKQSRAPARGAVSDTRRAQDDSDYQESPPRKRPTRAKAKAKANQPETYTISSDSSSENDDPPPIFKPQGPPKRPTGSTMTANSQSHNALITSYFDKEKHADTGSILQNRDDRPPPTKRLRLSRPSVTTPEVAPSSSRSATVVSPTLDKHILPPVVEIVPCSMEATVHGSNASGPSTSTSAPRPSPSPRKTTATPSQTISQLTTSAADPRPLVNGLNAPPAPGPPKSTPEPAAGSKDMPMQISDSEPEPERSTSPERRAPDDEWIHDLEATDPAPPPTLALLRSRSGSIPLSSRSRSPSPQIGPFQDECIYSLEGLPIRAEREDTPDVSDDEQAPDVDMAFDQRCSPRRGVSSRVTLRRAHTGLGLLHARLMAQDTSLYTSARIDAVKRLRAMGGLGPSLRTTAHNRKGMAYDFPPRTAHAFAASGAVNDVVQKNGWIAAGCSTSCIVHDAVAARDREPLPGPDNNQHTLAVFSPSRNRWDGHDAHSRPVHLPRERERQHVVASARHYTVEGVAWDPSHPSRLVSCGADGTVAMWQPTGSGHMGVVYRWDLASRSRERRTGTKYVYESASPDVAFPPHDAPLFAVGPSKTGQIYLHYGPLDGDGDFIIIELRRNRAPWGPLQCGYAASRRVLFAGVSGAYDIETAQELYMLPGIRDGQNVGVDATDLDPTSGKTLAVVTNKGRRTSRRLRLYDVNESAAKHITTVELGIDTRANRQVTALSFSPDGVLLALGHEDNSVYVYDSRFLPKAGERTQQALCRFVHGESAVPEEVSFGVTCIAWAPSRGPLACGAREDGLYSGGADGHVRLWRTGLSATSCHNGGIVASMCAGIGSFSLGDTFAGEKMLVVGDNNGRLAIWDRPIVPI